MKTRHKFGYVIIFSTLIFSACKKDGDFNSKELSAFIKSSDGDVHVANINFKRTPLAASGDSIAKFPAYLTREISSDALLDIAADESLVSAFNTAHETNYELLPAANYKIVGSTQLMIPAGSLISTDSLRVQILDRTKLNNEIGYILPLSIRNISGKDKGVKSSENYKTVYIIVKGSFSNISELQTTLAGTFVARTSWVLTVSNTTTGGAASGLLDGNNATAWRSSSSSSAEKWISIDMGAAQQIKGFVFVPNYVSLSENATGIDISTSLDNVTWTVQGSWEGSGPISTSSATNPDLKNINFIAPVQARYFRLDITSLVSGKRAGMAELNVVK
ncbi:discoidin domain-containing protein [Pedobacter arcticus]|uniref:discoidin domain-containing protein n=1 Tax=Pedobacter arcticus TaxID=752140 RepID=UPI00030FE708|nr:discoidin domain-containing protein [Pedobacter arcticus]